MKEVRNLKMNSEVVNSTLSDIVSSLINGGFEAAHGRTTMKETSMSVLHTAIDGAEQAIEFDDSTGDTSSLDRMSFEDVKSGIYSIIMAGISDGLNNVEEAETPTAQEALITARDAALSKSREVLPGMVCDRIQSQISSSFEERRTRSAERGTKSKTAAEIAGFATDSAEMLASRGVEGLRGVMSGESSVTEAVEATLADAKSEIPGMIFDRVQTKVSDSFDSQRAKIDGKTYKHRTSQDVAELASDSARVMAAHGIDNLRGVVSGEATVSDAIEATLADAKSEIPGLIFDKAQSRIADSFDAKRSKIDEKTYKHKGSKGAAAFANDSARAMAVHGVDNLRGVVSGDMTMTEAMEATMQDSVADISTNAVGKVTSKINEKLGLDFLDPTTVIETAKKVKDCFGEYINGEINGTQFFMKIGYDGLYQAAQTWGTAVGTHLAVSAGLHGAAAAMTVAASSTLVVAVYGELYNYAMEVFQEEIESEERMNNIRQLSAEAIEVIRKERETLLANTFMAAEHRQKVFQESLNDLSAAVETGNVELLTAALHKITEEVGGTIQFKTFEEFDDFMQDDSLALTF